MAITSIMREKLGTDKPLGSVTIDKNENALGVLRKGTMFIRRNLAKRDRAVSQKEIADILGYLFDLDGATLDFQQGFTEREESSFKDEADKKHYEDFKTQYNRMAWDLDDKTNFKVADLTWVQFMSDHYNGKEQLVTVFVGKPNQFKSERNGAIYSYRSVDGLTMQMNLDRLVSLGVLVSMYKDIGIIGEDELTDKIIRGMVHSTLPQSKTQINKNFGYSVNIKELGMERDDYVMKYREVSNKIVEGFKRSYRMELNIKLMEDYEKGMRGAVATAFETKKNIPQSILDVMSKSKFIGKGFKFVELDEDTDLQKYEIVEGYYLDIEKSLPVLPLKALRFRKLGKHKIGGSGVSGLYSPAHQSIAVDMRMFYSFVHEYAHAIDYLYEEGEIQSMQYGFTDILDKYEQLLPASIDNKSYYTTPTEVFARGFEVAFREKYPQLDTGLVPERERLSKMSAYEPFYKNKELFLAVNDYMKTYLK